MNIHSLQGFESLDPINYQPTSPATPTYNCIAWAAGDNSRFWWPWPTDVYYWPEDAPLEATLNAFIKAFSTLGYEICETGDLEVGYEKIVIYINPLTGQPTHAARQLSDGAWTSKLGKHIDIRHDTPENIQGSAYGTPSQYMRRKKPKRKRR
jgi:hypothetical protein